MAARSFTRYVEEELGKFPHFLVYALLEWVLIFILFLDGFLAFFANEFAKFFELKIPCWLCTRIDHILVRKNVPDLYYNESICESHKKEVSSLAFCHNHKKLSDIRKMCEGCLLSFATEKESDIDTYKSLVGILHKDLECFVEEDQQIQLSLRDDDGMLVEKSNNQRCSCCGKSLKMKSHPKGKNLGLVSHAPAPSPRAYPYVASKNEGLRALELSHIRYSQLKCMSEKDMEQPEAEGGSNVNGSEIKIREDARASVPLLTENEDSNEEFNRTPPFVRGNKFFGIPLTDSPNVSPRWSYRINRRSPLEKTVFASDSNEGNIQNEVDDDIFNHLKSSQVRLDRKSLMALYMELDEERSASAIAANNAMAMITRLQAEKAAVQMEALQYQRMMEEQAEYDEEALQATNGMLVKREEEIRALEAELNIYREKFGLLSEDDLKDVRYETSEFDQMFKSQPCSFQEDASSPGISEGDDNGVGRTSELLKSLKGEKKYILGLKKTERNRSLLAENGLQSPESSSDGVNNIDNERGKGVASLAGLSSMTEIVKALEADSGFLEFVSQNYEDDGEGTNILTGISENLEKLRHLVMAPSQSQAENE